MGFHIFTFDFSGHGRSSGKLGFDNAQTDKLANQVLQAKQILKEKANLDDSNILMLGHSMGARVALQATLMDEKNCAGLILLGTQINLQPNTQSEFFTGIKDSELDWIKDLSENNPPLDILLISGMWDDIIPPDAAQKLHQTLGGNDSPYNRELVIMDGVLHNYEIYSPKVLSYAKEWSADLFNLENIENYQANTMLVRKVCWIIGLLSLFFLIGGIIKIPSLKKSSESPEEKMSAHKMVESMHISDIKRFLAFKTLFWLFSLPLIIGLFSLFMLIPIGVPVFNLIYVGFIGGYGLTLALVYRKGKMPGTEGIFQFKNLKSEIIELKQNKKLIIYGLLIFGLITVCTTLFARTGIYYVYPLNERIIWLILFTLFTIPGFLIGALEKEAVRTSKFDSPMNMVVLNLIGLFPFILFVILYIAIGSLSGMIGGIHGLIILVLVFLMGTLLYKKTRNILFTVICQSFLIQYLILPQGVLFGVF